MYIFISNIFTTNYFHCKDIYITKLITPHTSNTGNFFIVHLLECIISYVVMLCIRQNHYKRLLSISIPTHLYKNTLIFSYQQEKLFPTNATSKEHTKRIYAFQKGQITCKSMDE